VTQINGEFTVPGGCPSTTCTATSRARTGGLLPGLGRGAGFAPATA
jgi:hypothetical protein